MTHKYNNSTPSYRKNHSQRETDFVISDFYTGLLRRELKHRNKLECTTTMKE